MSHSLSANLHVSLSEETSFHTCNDKGNSCYGQLFAVFADSQDLLYLNNCLTSRVSWSSIVTRFCRTSLQSVFCDCFPLCQYWTCYHTSFGLSQVILLSKLQHPPWNYSLFYFVCFFVFSPRKCKSRSARLFNFFQSCSHKGPSQQTPLNQYAPAKSSFDSIQMSSLFLERKRQVFAHQFRVGTLIIDFCVASLENGHHQNAGHNSSTQQMFSTDQRAPFVPKDATLKDSCNRVDCHNRPAHWKQLSATRLAHQKWFGFPFRPISFKCASKCTLKIFFFPIEQLSRGAFPHTQTLAQKSKQKVTFLWNRINLHCSRDTSSRQKLSRGCLR